MRKIKHFKFSKRWNQAEFCVCIRLQTVLSQSGKVLNIWIECLIDVSMGWPGWPGWPEGWPKPPSRPPRPPRQCSWPPHLKTHEKPPFGPPSARQATPIPLATLSTTPGRSHLSCHPSHPLGQPSTMIIVRWLVSVSFGWLVCFHLRLDDFNLSVDEVNCLHEFTPWLHG